jgi:hypothetical protein
MDGALTSAFRLVELEGNALRASRLLTGRLKTWEVQNIFTVNRIGLKEMGLPEMADVNKGKGFEIEFCDGAKLLLSRHEMGAINKFIVALADWIKIEFPEPNLDKVIE